MDLPVGHGLGQRFDHLPAVSHGLQFGGRAQIDQKGIGLLGIFQAFTPKFVKRYANLGAEIRKAFEAYVEDVSDSRFPEAAHTYRMVDGELDRLMGQLKK